MISTIKNSLQWRYIVPIAIAICVANLCAGCGKKPAVEQKGHELVGIVYKAGKGLRISDETKKIIGLQVVEASDRKLTAEVVVSLEVYSKAGKEADATGFVSNQDARGMKVGDAVALTVAGSKGEFGGTIARLLPLDQSGQTEVLVHIANAHEQLMTGMTLRARFSEPVTGVTAIPRSAVLTTATGTFSYVVNGDCFFRTAIKTGAQDSEFVEVKDGLYAGDQVVKQPVMTLWLAELQVIKGGADND